MERSPKIFRRDAKGKLRIWYYEIDGAKWRGVGGLVNGKMSASGWTVAKPKNVGKSNETTPERQAWLEAAAELNKKLDREYRRDPDLLDNVPPAPMLARDFAKVSAKDRAKWDWPVLVQPKLDGIRCLNSLKHGTYSREYQPFYNIDHIKAAVASILTKYPGITLDGELYNHALKDDFNSISSIVRTEDATEEDRARSRDLIQYHIYDYIPDNDIPFGDRFGKLTEIFADPNLVDYNAPLWLVQTLTAHDQAEIDEQYAQFLDAGYEGQIIRFDGPYECDVRSKMLLKRKEWETGEFKLVDIQEGEGTWAGAAKRILYELPGKGVVGAGLRGDMEFAKRLLAERDKYLGAKAQVTIEFFKQLTPDGKHRFARAIDFHPQGRRD